MEVKYVILGGWLHKTSYVVFDKRTWEGVRNSNARKASSDVFRVALISINKQTTASPSASETQNQDAFDKTESRVRYAGNTFHEVFQCRHKIALRLVSS